MYYRAVDEFVNNLVGAFGLAVADGLTRAVVGVVGHSGALAAAVSYLLQEPDSGIEDLREPLGLSQPAAVRLVNQMVEDGLATRSSDARDGRRVRIRLTSRGRSVAHGLLRAREQAINEVIGAFSPDEQRTLAALLSKSLAATTEQAADAERLCRLCDTRACPPDRCPIGGAVTARAD
jgi:DNA-binding MarR family transcriptional regulator